MYRILLIAKNNMKKQKSDMITFFILTLLTAFLIFDSTSAILGLGRILEDRFKAVNGAHVMIFNHDTEAETEAAERAISENSHILDYERTPMIQFMTDYRKKGDEKFSVYAFFAESFTEEKRIMKIGTPRKEYQKNDILLPYLMKGNYKEGDVLQIKLGDDVYDFTVVGYLEDPYFCSTLNITIYYVGMSPEMIEELSADHPVDVARFNVHKGIADCDAFPSGFSTNDLEQEITSKYKEYLNEYEEKNSGGNFMDYMGNNWEMMKGGSQFLPVIVTSIILVFAVMILVIALVIISFSIKNFIQRNMKNTGILEASGYTVSELRLSLIMQIMLVAMVGAFAGIALAMLTFRQFGDVVSSVLGLRWNQPINWGAAAATILGILLVIGLVGFCLSSTYKRISVLDALRGGINTHNFKKNYFPLEKTPLPVPVVLSLKDTFGGIGRNMIMVFISAVLVIATLIGFGLVENFAKNQNGLVKMMAFETCTDMVVAPTSTKDISDDLRKVEGVDNVLVNFGFEPVVSFGGKKSTEYAYAVDDLNNTRCTNLLEGRYPEKENELMMTQGTANDFNAKIGDVVELEFAGRTEEFLVTGIYQRIERMGRTLYLRIDGAKKLLPGDVTSGYQYYVDAKEGVSFEQLKENISYYAKEEGLELQHTDLVEQMEGTIVTVVMAVKAICVGIILLTFVIVIFVESLVIRAKIARDWRGMGISKALGQTSGGLILQLMLSNVPAILTGAIIGGILSSFVGGGMIKAMFSLFAIRKVVFDIPVYYVFISIAGIIAVAVLTSAVAGLKVRKFKAVAMITEE